MRNLLIATCAVVALAQPVAAQGQAICKKRSEIINILGSKYGETRRSFGLQQDSRVLELFASENGSWTAILSLPSGMACVVATGEAWTVVPPEPAGDPA